MTIAVRSGSPSSSGPPAPSAAGSSRAMPKASVRTTNVSTMATAAVAGIRPPRDAPSSMMVANAPGAPSAMPHDAHGGAPPGRNARAYAPAMQRHEATNADSAKRVLIRREAATCSGGRRHVVVRLEHAFHDPDHQHDRQHDEEQHLQHDDGRETDGDQSQHRNAKDRHAEQRTQDEETGEHGDHRRYSSWGCPSLRGPPGRRFAWGRPQPKTGSLGRPVAKPCTKAAPFACAHSSSPGVSTPSAMVAIPSSVAISMVLRAMSALYGSRSTPRTRSISSLTKSGRSWCRRLSDE